MEKREARKFYLYTAPWLIGFLILTLYPMIYSLYLSFTDMNLTGQGKFVKFENYIYAFTKDPLFFKAFFNLTSKFFFTLCRVCLKHPATSTKFVISFCASKCSKNTSFSISFNSLTLFFKIIIPFDFFFLKFKLVIYLFAFFFAALNFS